MAHNSAEKNPNFGKRETIDSSSSWKRKRWGERGNATVLGGALVSEERCAEARETFGGLSPGEYDLGDYVLYFTGVALAKEGNAAEAAVTLDRLVLSFPESPLAPYLAQELAFAAAKADDLPAARNYFEASRGKVAGNGRKAAEKYIEARLLEEKGMGEEGNVGLRKNAEAQLANFSSQKAQARE